MRNEKFLKANLLSITLIFKIELTVIILIFVPFGRFHNSLGQRQVHPRSVE